MTFPDDFIFLLLVHRRAVSELTPIPLSLHFITHQFIFTLNNPFLQLMAGGGLFLRMQKSVTFFLSLGEGGGWEAFGDLYTDFSFALHLGLLHEGRLYFGQLT